MKPIVNKDLEIYNLSREILISNYAEHNKNYHLFNKDKLNPVANYCPLIAEDAVDMAISYLNYLNKKGLIELK